MEYAHLKKELESIDFYQNLRKELNKLPPDIKQVILELANKPFWIEIGKALNSFPITEEVNKFKLKQKLESYMRTNSISDLDLDNELTKLQDKRYIYAKPGSMPNYFCTFEFSQAIQIMTIIESYFVSPLAQALEKRPEFKEVDLKRSLSLQVYSLVET
jgi:hypothetical protein